MRTALSGLGLLVVGVPTAYVLSQVCWMVVFGHFWVVST